MFKFILIAILIIYALIRFSGFLLRIMGSSQQRHESYQQPNNAQTRVDRNPKNEKKPFDGGEYIDYEEVK